MARINQSTQKKPTGASLIRRQPPPRFEKAQKRSEHTAAMADMRRRQALFLGIYADTTEKLQAVQFGVVASRATADVPARVVRLLIVSG